MPIAPTQDESRQPAEPQKTEVEKLYDSCCGSCASPSPTNSGMTVADLTVVTTGTDSGQKNGNP